MEVIKLNCRNQRLSRVNSGVVASNSSGYLKIQVNFLTNDWSKVSVKMAQFSYCGRNYPRLLDEDGMCFVPEEVLKIIPRCPYKFKISVFGGGITTNMVTIEFEDSGTTPYEDESISVKYYNEIINKLSATIDDLNESKANNIIYNEDENYIQLTANGKPIGDKIEMYNCGIKSFDVDENDNITITLLDGRVIDLGHIAGASGATFIPHISDDKILTWTNDKDLPNPEPVDLNPFDEWGTLGEEENSDYVWENLV